MQTEKCVFSECNPESGIELSGNSTAASSLLESDYLGSGCDDVASLLDCSFSLPAERSESGDFPLPSLPTPLHIQYVPCTVLSPPVLSHSEILSGISSCHSAGDSVIQNSENESTALSFQQPQPQPQPQPRELLSTEPPDSHIQTTPPQHQSQPQPQTQSQIERDLQITSQSESQLEFQSQSGSSLQRETQPPSQSPSLSFHSTSHLIQLPPSSSSPIETSSLPLSNSILQSERFCLVAKRKLSSADYDLLFAEFLTNNEVRARLYRETHPQPKILTELLGKMYFLYVEKNTRKPPKVGFPFRCYTDSHYTSVDRRSPVICKVKEWPSPTESDKVWRLYHYYCGKMRYKRSRDSSNNSNDECEENKRPSRKKQRINTTSEENSEKEPKSECECKKNTTQETSSNSQHSIQSKTAV